MTPSPQLLKFVIYKHFFVGGAMTTTIHQSVAAVLQNESVWLTHGSVLGRVLIHHPPSHTPCCISEWNPPVKTVEPVHEIKVFAGTLSRISMATKKGR